MGPVEVEKGTERVVEEGVEGGGVIGGAVSATRPLAADGVDVLRLSDLVDDVEAVEAPVPVAWVDGVEGGRSATPSEIGLAADADRNVDGTGLVERAI